MLDTFKQLLSHQFDASLSTLNLCIARYLPDPLWDQPIATWKFCQSAFHVTFFTDLYLQPTDNIDSLRHQPFHLQHPDAFRHSEELEDRSPSLLYAKPFILAYLQHSKRPTPPSHKWPTSLARPLGLPLAQMLALSCTSTTSATSSTTPPNSPSASASPPTSTSPGSATRGKSREHPDPSPVHPLAFTLNR